MKEDTFYVSSDYAGLSAGNVRFYYGYEKLIPVEAESDDDDEYAHGTKWAFVAWENGEELFRFSAADLGVDDWECVHVLLAGIARYFSIKANSPTKGGE